MWYVPDATSPGWHRLKTAPSGLPGLETRSVTRSGACRWHTVQPALPLAAPWIPGGRSKRIWSEPWLGCPELLGTFEVRDTTLAGGKLHLHARKLAPFRAFSSDA